MVHSVSSTYGLTVVHSSTTKEHSRTTSRSFYELTRHYHSSVRSTNSLTTGSHSTLVEYVLHYHK